MSSVYDPSRPESADIFDYLGAMDRLGQDAELFNAIAGFFLADSPALLARIRENASGENQAELALAAHTLVGLASNFGADRVTSAAAIIESAARNGESTSSMDLHPLESAVEELNAALRRHLEAGASVRRSPK